MRALLALLLLLVCGPAPAVACVRLAYPTLEVGGKMLPKNYRAQPLIDHFNVCHR
ncbi:MAG: hypothetical protein JKP92_06620 [Alphaproteobacteria bacterium]|jgi:hypothetical protein|nr:hypothetical protein [Alphaproteobacteria bacterium]